MLLSVILITCFNLVFRLVNCFVVSNHCVNVKNDVYKDCFKDQISYKELYRGFKSERLPTTKCFWKCSHMNFTIMRRQLWGIKTANLFTKMLKDCCGPCASYNVTNTVYQLNEINESITNNSDVIMPVLGFKSSTKIYGFHFIPVLEAPRAYYFTLRPTQRENVLKLIKGILGLWPLIVICILLSCLSGIVMWCMERGSNVDEFPKRFHSGLFEGFWWSFVSMTTVGYGDKTPKSYFGRIFAIFWILSGITMIAILTGTLTNRIMSIQSPSGPNMSGKRIGGLNQKLVDATMIAQHGGSLHEVDSNNTVIGIFNMMDKLKRKEIDGFLITQPLYLFFLTLVDRKGTRNYKRYQIRKERVKDVDFDIAERRFLGEKLAIGVLLKNHDAYKFFHQYIEDNWLVIQNCIEFDINKKVNKLLPKSSTVAFGGPLSNSFIYILIGALVVICCTGTVIEIWSYYCENKSKTTGKEVIGEKVRIKL